MRTPAPNADAESSTGPLTLWLVMQLSVMALAAGRVPLSAQHVQPAERLAPHLLLGAQVVVASLLFPFLVRDIRCAVQIIATAIPFQLAAAYLAGLDVNAILQPAGFVVLWLVTLGVWASILRFAPGQLLGVAVAACLTVGGAVVRYLRLEFSPDVPAGATVESVSPLLATLIAVAGSPTFPGWTTLLCLLIVGLSGKIVGSRLSRTTPKFVRQ